MRELNFPELFARAARGDQSAWAVLVLGASESLLRVARAHRLGEADALDVCQSTWLMLTQRLPTVRQPSCVPGWLATTARRLALSTLARRNKEAAHIARCPETFEPSPELRVLLRERDITVRRVVERLPANQRHLLWLLAFRPELTHAQLADELGIAVGSVGPFRKRCLDLVRRRLIAEGIEHE